MSRIPEGGSDMAKVIGVGGIFLQCEDVEATKAWYKTVMGVEQNQYGGWDFSHAEAGAAFPTGARTIFAPFEKSDYFKPSELPYMLNLMVDDLEGLLEKLKAKGIEECQPSAKYDYGHFAWLLDPDGRKVELWQPIEPAE